MAVAQNTAMTIGLTPQAGQAASPLAEDCEAAKKGVPPERRTTARDRWQRVAKAAVRVSSFVGVLTARRQTYEFVNEDGGVFKLIKILFALPQFSLIPLTLLINVFLITFYNDIGVSIAFISFFQIFARSFDVLTDPMMAHISDNLTKTRFGRRLPYMMLCPCYAVAFFILVSPPKDNPTVATFWFGGSYIVFYLCDTVVNVPFQALGPELTDDTIERTSLYMFVKIAEGVGIIIGTLTPSVLVDYTSLNQQRTYQLIALVFGTWYMVSMFALIKNVKERPASILGKGEVIQPFVTSIYRSLSNTAFRPLVFGWMCDFASLSFITTMLPFFVKYYLEADSYGENSSETVLGFALACLFVSGFCCIPIWFYLSSEDRKGDSFLEQLKIGRINSWLTYNVVNCITNFLFVFVGPGDIGYLYFCMIMNGIPFGGQFLINSVLADVIDYDEFLNYTRNEGQFSVFAQFIPKLIAIPCQSLPLVLMFSMGYQDPDSDDDYVEQIARVKWFIRIMVVFVPLCLVTGSYLIKRRFPIRNHEMMTAISEGISKHLQGLPAVDPCTGKEVWIEELDDTQLMLAYLLDHFSHNQLLWLLSPDEIYKRHVAAGMPLRKNTLRHITIHDEKDDEKTDDPDAATPDDPDDAPHIAGGDVTEEPQTRQRSMTKQSVRDLRTKRAGWCGCFKFGDSTDESNEIKDVVEGNDEVQFGRSANGEIMYVCVGDFEAHGIERGTKRLERAMLLWVLTGLVVLVLCIIGVGNTISLLTDKNLCVVPAVFCLLIGLSVTGMGFAFLRYKAAGEIRDFTRENKITESELARIIYPKTKGQRGGGGALDEKAVERIDKILPRATAHPAQLKSLDMGQLVGTSPRARQKSLLALFPENSPGTGAAPDMYE